MFKKILIANRGEIACRIICSAQKMGIETVAVYSVADKDSLAVRRADKAIYIGEAPAQSSYLHIPAIIEAAKKTKAEAIHPGYGFLSENPEFAKACEKAGIVFIGPSIQAMNAMASKKISKQLLEKSTVPLTPGYHGNNQDQDCLAEEAEKMGFPILLKAAAGGGGKGMRAVYHREEFLDALTGAKREALASFADDQMIIEKLIENPRHVEIQIMADNFGEVVHLFERDCSIQRRHQKIIEEAPAPNLSQALRQTLAEAACTVAKTIEYRGAGTVEFLVDKNEQFYFMEMNTRLQVEHPVTEAITGLDLVEWQIKIAANQPLPRSQAGILFVGHAIECRIYAEDPEQHFLPSIGKLSLLKEPSGLGIRIDTGVEENAYISQYYDPLIAKLIVWGENREQAIFRMQEALKNYAIGGVKTNLGFLQAIFEQERFINAQLSTEFLNQVTLKLPQLSAQESLLLAAGYDYHQLTTSLDSTLTQACFAWQNQLSSTWYWRYDLNGETCHCTIKPITLNQFYLETEQFKSRVEVNLRDEQLCIRTADQQLSAWIEVTSNALLIHCQGQTAQVHRHRWQRDEAASQNNQLTAPMAATLVAVLKQTGEAVKKGDALLVLEAMKMEHTICAPHDGIVAELFYTTGAQVQEGTQLLLLKD